MRETNSRKIFDDLKRFIAEETFSCVAAKTASHKQTIIHRDYPNKDHDVLFGLHADLEEFSRGRRGLSETTATFIATFSELSFQNETEYERWLWDLLQELHDIDVSKGFSWNKNTSCFPSDVNFSYSSGGQSFFIVGMHQSASRMSRRTPFPSIAFNSHEQFKTLKTQGVYGRLQKAIRARELELQGSINPNLNDFGEASEARQYAGRATDEAWTCPFNPRINSKELINE